MTYCIKAIQRLFIIFIVILIAGCSKAVMDDINAIIKSSFGEYTKENPLKIFAMPFKSGDKLAGESSIGKIAWEGAVDGVRDTAFFSDGRLEYKIIKDKDYMDTLRKDPFWNDMAKGGDSVKHILSSTASRHKVNGIVYGLYDGDDSGLKLIVYFYSKNDDIILKEKTGTQANFMDLESLQKTIEEKGSLSVKQKELRKMIHEKSKVATTHLLRKYMEGRN